MVGKIVIIIIANDKEDDERKSLTFLKQTRKPQKNTCETDSTRRRGGVKL